MKGIDLGPHTLLTIEKYQELNAATDRNPSLDRKDIHLPLVGLFGETGSLVTLFKKKWRDQSAYIHMSEDLVEEIGDLLWYITNVAGRAGLSLENVARTAFPELKHFKPSKGMAFVDIDRLVKSKAKITPDEIVSGIAKLGDCAAKILVGSQSKNFKKKLQTYLGTMLKSLLRVAAMTGNTLDEAARFNVIKTIDRWPVSEETVLLFDTAFNEHEQLPRQFTVEFQEVLLGNKTFVYQKFNGVHVGDRLTDNISDPDYYRFHDAFHWAYAAVLGWSPVTRALLRCKRKSRSSVDENQDGARAVIIEEAISVWIFHQAKELKVFEGIESLDFRILKAVRDLTKGFEAENIPLWLWEEAILSGYKIFRDLKTHRRGFLIGDLIKRSIAFKLRQPPR